MMRSRMINAVHGVPRMFAVRATGQLVGFFFGIHQEYQCDST
jgi:hypothetical protein